VEVACKEAERLGLKKVGLFGIRFTMQGHFYPDVFAKAGIDLAIPTVDEQDYIHDKYLNELVPGIVLPETREHLLKVMDRMKNEEGVEGLILGGTELPLILKDAQYQEIPFLDTTQIHVKHAVAELLA
jgi:aspartate racemase